MKKHWIITALLLLTGVSAWALTPDPSGGIYMGVYVNENDDAFTTEAEIENVETMLNRSPLHHIKVFKSWFEEWNYPAYESFDLKYKEDFDRIYANGSIVHLAWEAWDFHNKTGFHLLDDINNGVHDDYIRSVALKIKEYYPDKEMMIDLFHEANGNWYPWSPAMGTTQNDRYAAFRNAYKRIVNIYRQNGVNNITWVFTVTNNTSSGLSTNFNDYYPGTEYVDWNGIDGYNWGTSQSWGSRWESVDQVLSGNSNTYNQMAGFGKPLIYAEFSCTESGGDKASWIQDCFNKMGTLYDFKAFTYFHINKETDWRINSSGAALSAFREAMTDGQKFIGGGSAPPILLGDVNSDGVVNIIDALMISQYYVGLNPAGFNGNAGDVNCDGTVNIIDALMVSQFYVGLLTSFC